MPPGTPAPDVAPVKAIRSTLSRTASATWRLEDRRDLAARAVAAQDGHGVGVVVEADARCARRRWPPSGRRPWPRAWPRRASMDAVGLGREPDQDLSRAPAAAELGQDVGGRLEDELGHARRPCDSLVSDGALGRKSATAAAMTTTSAPSARARARPRSISAAVSTRTTVDAGRRRPAASWSPGPRRRPAPAAASASGVALLARRPVGDEADRVDRLAGPAGADHHPSSRRGPGTRREVPEPGRPARTSRDGGHDVTPARPGDRPRRHRRPAGPRPGPPRGRPGGAGWPGCPGRRGAPTSRCAWPGRPPPGPGWRARWP